MMQTNVRISAIELHGFKNTKHGLVQMPSSAQKQFFQQACDILGIYGQNGSGKTAVIDAMQIIQTLLMGDALPASTVHYISKEAEICDIAVKFTVQTAADSAMVEYAVTLARHPVQGFEIVRESLHAAAWDGQKFATAKHLIEYDATSSSVLFTPKYRFDRISKSHPDALVNLHVAKKMAQKEGSSFIFGADGRHVFLSAARDISGEYAYAIKALYEYAHINLFVISSAHTGTISSNFMLPFAFRLEEGGQITKGDLPIRLDQPSLISQPQFHIITQIISELNHILSTIIPHLTIEIHNFGEQLIGDGSVGNKIELVSKRGDIRIPLKYESEGIIKIISVLNALLCVYNQPSMCLIIDELDAGIFEYLLGELLAVFESGAKGQLIFTSHNLRALEMIDQKNVIFSTTNSANRYIRLQTTKSHHNLRDMYLRSITLGGQKEDVYDETDSIEIGRAFRRAGKAMQYDEKSDAIHRGRSD